MFYIKSNTLSKLKGHDCYYCMDDNFDGIKDKFNQLIKKGITDICIISDDPNFVF